MRRGVSRLKGIKVINKPDGRRYVYRRVQGALIPLPDLPENHPEFLRAYAAAGLAKPAPRSRDPQGTIAALCTVYLASQDHHRKAPSTRAVFARVIHKIRAERGTGLLAHLQTAHIRKDVRALTPGAAATRLKAWRSLMKYAVEEGLIETNPAKDVTAPKSVTISHHQWTQDEITAYRKHWPIGSAQRTAMEVIYWTGARCVDAVRLGRQMVKHGWLTYTQQKTGGPASCPVANLPTWCIPLQGDLDHFTASLDSGRILWIATSTGAARSVKGLSQFVSAAADTAGLPKNCTAHGLRSARAAALAEIGASTHQIGAWTGHASLSEIAHYTKKADQIGILSGGEQRTPESTVVPIKNKE